VGTLPPRQETPESTQRSRTNQIWEPRSSSTRAPTSTPRGPPRRRPEPTAPPSMHATAPSCPPLARHRCSTLASRVAPPPPTLVGLRPPARPGGGEERGRGGAVARVSSQRLAGATREVELTFDISTCRSAGCALCNPTTDSRHYMDWPVLRVVVLRQTRVTYQASLSCILCRRPCQ
jgi:hypothetical protein